MVDVEQGRRDERDGCQGDDEDQPEACLGADLFAVGIATIEVIDRPRARLSFLHRFGRTAVRSAVAEADDDRDGGEGGQQGDDRVAGRLADELSDLDFGGDGDGGHDVCENGEQADDGQYPAQRPDIERVGIGPDEVLRGVRVLPRQRDGITELFEDLAFDGGRAIRGRGRILAEAGFDHVVDRGGDLGGDVGTGVFRQVAGDVVDVDFGERTHGVPSFQSWVMLELSSSQWLCSAAATSAPLSVSV